MGPLLKLAGTAYKRVITDCDSKFPILIEAMPMASVSQTLQTGLHH